MEWFREHEKQKREKGKGRKWQSVSDRENRADKKEPRVRCDAVPKTQSPEPTVVHLKQKSRCDWTRRQNEKNPKVEKERRRQGQGQTC